MDNKIKNIFETLINFWNEHNQTISILAAALIPIKSFENIFNLVIHFFSFFETSGTSFFLS
jgi:hypothetical protein